MASEDTNLKERLKGLLIQLRTESNILGRIIYKGKNQHRRCSYFQYLLKVNRDVRLLQSAGLEDILNSLCHITDGKKPKQKIYHLERLKKNNPRGKHNFQERLLGIARLLSQMFEPIVKAGIEISSLLARTFFMGFSLAILAILARIRVLVQQILLDVVSIYNMVSSLSQKEHSVKITQGEIEAFREYYPPNVELIVLECVWEGDKFVLREGTQTSEMKKQDVPPETPPIQYETIDVLSEEDLSCEKINKGCPVEKMTSSSDSRHTYNASKAHYVSDGAKVEEKEDKEHMINEISNCAGSAWEVAKLPNNQSDSRRKVAFISVRKHALSVTSETRPHKMAKLDWPLRAHPSEIKEAEEDPFFSLLTAGSKNNGVLG